MGDTKRGIYHKFNVERTDGKSGPGQKHDGCRYFVLDLDHDEFAPIAMAAYAGACIKKYPKLGYELLDSVASQVGSVADAFGLHMECGEEKK